MKRWIGDVDVYEVKNACPRVDVAWRKFGTMTTPSTCVGIGIEHGDRGRQGSCSSFLLLVHTGAQERGAQTDFTTTHVIASSSARVALGAELTQKTSLR